MVVVVDAAETDTVCAKAEPVTKSELMPVAESTAVEQVPDVFVPVQQLLAAVSSTNWLELTKVAVSVAALHLAPVLTGAVQSMVAAVAEVLSMGLVPLLLFVPSLVESTGLVAVVVVVAILVGALDLVLALAN